MYSLQSICTNMQPLGIVVSVLLAFGFENSIIKLAQLSQIVNTDVQQLVQIKSDANKANNFQCWVPYLANGQTNGLYSAHVIVLIHLS